MRYALQQLSQEGHCGFPEPGVLDKTQQLVGIDLALLQDAAESELAAGHLVREAVLDGNWLYLAALHRAETGLAQHIHRLLRNAVHPLPQINLGAALDWVQAGCWPT